MTQNNATTKYPLQMFSEREFYSLSPETQLQIRVADHLCREYPDVIFHSDYGSGARLRPKQYKIQSAQNGNKRAWPDLFIAEHKMLPVKNENAPSGYDVRCFGGLYIELKKDGERLFAVKCKPMDTRRSVDGKVYATDHIREQADVLYGLRQRGYRAEFAVGLDEAQKIISNYLKG